MTKKEMVKSIAEKVGTPSVTVSQVVQMVFDGITETLVSERRIELRNFGVFEVRERKGRKGRNPRSGEPVMVPSRNVVVFKPGREMTDEVRRVSHAPTDVRPATVE